VSEKFRLVKAEKAMKTPVKVSCEVLGVSRSGYYDWERHVPSKRQLSDERLLALIREIHADNELVYGSPRIHAELRLEYGIRVGRKRVERLMRQAGISGLVEKKRGRTTVRVPGVKVASDKVLRNFTAERPNQLWVADITYLKTWEGWVYLAAVQDAYSRRIVGWSMADHMKADLVVDALQMAIKRRRPDPGLIHHSDRGGQYVSLVFGKVAKDNGIAQSMGQTGTAYDNSLAESFFATLKKEKINRRSWPSKQEMKTAVFEYIESFYNRRRRHSYLGYLAPAEFEGEARLPLVKAA
jgi:putative transposase